MTELELMMHARTYIRKLANGINPLTDKPVPENDCVNNIRISRCLFYVAEVMDRAIKAQGPSSKKSKLPFSISPERCKDFAFSKDPITISEIANRINALVDTNTMKKFSYSYISDFLIDNGYLKQTKDSEGKSVKTVTEKGTAIGIKEEERIFSKGQFKILTYNLSAQKFILDNIQILITSKENKNKHVPFSITQEKLKEFSFSKDPITISEITKRLNLLIDQTSMEKIKAIKILDFLVMSGYIAQSTDNTGKRLSRPTERGFAAGMCIEKRQDESGMFTLILYDEQAQHLVVDSIQSILQS